MSFSALKIHVSEDCYRILKEIGGYTFLKRGEVYLKVIWIAVWLTLQWKASNLRFTFSGITCKTFWTILISDKNNFRKQNRAKFSSV